MGGSRIRAAAVVVVMALAASPVAAEAKTSFRTSGTCHEYATGIPVDTARAQAMVPVGFSVLEVGGRALVAVFAQRCATSVDGGPVQRSIVSGVFVFLNPAVSPGGCQAYDWAWQDSIRSDWLRAFKDLGWRMELVRSRFSPGSDAYSMGVRSKLAPWSATHTATSADAVPIPLTTVHCQVGPRGLVRGTYDHEISGVGVGAGPIQLGRGRLWRSLGAASQETAPGLVLRFTWTGTTEIVPT